MVLEFELNKTDYRYYPVNYQSQAVIQLAKEWSISLFELSGLRQAGFNIKLSRGKNASLIARGNKPAKRRKKK